MKFCKTRKRLLAYVLSAVLLIVMASGPVYAYSTSRLHWSQATESTKRWGECSLTPGKNINTSGVELCGVATSPEDGTFTVRLQCKTGLLWSYEGNTYVVNQTSGRYYDSVNHEYVNGWPFRLIWPTNVSGQYRIVFSKPTNPQNLVFTNLDLHAYGTDY